MIETDELLSRVREYVRLQDVLLTSLHQIAPRLAEHKPWSWPQSGELNVEGHRWTFQRHGAGFKFTSPTGIVADAHEHITSPPFPFDAFRLDRYIRSLRPAGDTSPLGATEELDEIEAALASLERDGHVTVDPRGAERRFRAYLLT